MGWEPHNFFATVFFRLSEIASFWQKPPATALNDVTSARQRGFDSGITVLMDG